MLKTKRIFSALAAFALALAVVFTAPAGAVAQPGSGEAQRLPRVQTRLNLAVLIQDDLVPRVGNELAVTGEFIRSLPAGSRVMVGYIRTGSLQVRQPFTDDLQAATRALRIPVGSSVAAPFNPYAEVIEAIRQFEADASAPNAILLISDGLDISRGFDISSNANTLDLHRAIRAANERNVAVYSFYAPSVGLTSWHRTAASFGQNSLKRLSDETGGRAFFQGLYDFVTFDAHFRNLSRTLNERYGRIS